MSKICCELNLFDLKQNVYIVDNKEVKFATATTMDELPKVVSTLCKERDINEVVIIGNEACGGAIADSILIYSNKNYAMNNIEIEVLR